MALQHEPKLLFVLAGDGEDRNELIRQVADAGIAENVVFTGFVRGQRRRDIYNLSDIFVMSSISEPFGLSALEAAHYDNVLILTKQCGVVEVLPGAVQYDFWDEERLARAIVAVAQSAELQERLRAATGAEYTQISWDDIATQCLAAYQKAVANSRATGVSGGVA